MRTYETEVGVAPRLDVRIRTGTVVVVTGDPGRMQVELSGPDEDAVEVDTTPHGIVVRVPERNGGFLLRRRDRVDVRAVVPADTRVEAATAVGDITVTGAVEEVSAKTASGDIDVDEVTTLQAKAASGAVRVAGISRDGEVKIASGSLRIGRITGRLDAKAASGDVTIGEATGSLTIRSASGDVTIDRMLDGTVEVKTASGDTTVGIPPRRRVTYDLKGLDGKVHLPTDPAPPDDGPTEGRVDVQVKAVSGGLYLKRVD